MLNAELHIVIGQEKSFFRVQTVLCDFGQSSNKCIAAECKPFLVEWKYKGDWIRFLIGVKRSKCYWQVEMDGTYHIKCKQYGILIDTSNYWVSHQCSCMICSNNGILLQKLFWPTVRKNCSSDRENFWNLRLKAENLQNFWDH